MNKYQTGWRDNQEPTTTLKDLKATLASSPEDMLDEEPEEVQDDYMDYINQEVNAINNK
jgi:hypothetical protein